MFEGSLGEPDGGWPEEMQEMVLRGGSRGRGGRASIWRRSIWQTAQAMLEEKVGHEVSQTDVMSYLMYPEVFLKFAAARSSLWGRGRAADAAVLLWDGEGRGSRRSRSSRARR